MKLTSIAPLALSVSLVACGAASNTPSSEAVISVPTEYIVQGCLLGTAESEQCMARPVVRTLANSEVAIQSETREGDGTAGRSHTLTFAATPQGEGISLSGTLSATMAESTQTWSFSLVATPGVAFALVPADAGVAVMELTLTPVTAGATSALDQDDPWVRAEHRFDLE